jgi:hypothetical protein
MSRLAGWLPSPVVTTRIVLVGFVLAWLFGPYMLRATVPIWVAFVIAAGLELHFFVEALRGAPARRPDRGPLDVDRERYGYTREPQEMLLLREGADELWIPYAGETGEELEALAAEARARSELGAGDAEPAQQAWAPSSDPEPSFRERWPALYRLAGGLAVIGALALVFWLVDSRSGWGALDEQTRAAAEARFSNEASVIAGKPVTIACDESGRNVGVVQHADGVAVVGGELAYLTPERCLDLYRLAFEGEVNSSQTARALAVLAHEAWHLHGVRDEGTTECYALQSAVELGRRLGLSQSTAEQMMRQQLVENVDRGEANAEYLVPAGCRNGGPLDLDPGSQRFP